jgi:MFS family permease
MVGQNSHERHRLMEPADTHRSRWVQLGLLALVELLAMSLWFSASSVAPALAHSWALSTGQVSWLTISVQLGFVAGALLSAVLNLPEKVPAPRLIAGCALAGAFSNAVIPLMIGNPLGQTTWGFALVIALRFSTGMALAGVYPPGMKIVASWFLHGRGLGIGILVGAVTFGSATPHLINVFPLDAWFTSKSEDLPAWRLVMLAASCSAAFAAFVAATKIRLGPHLPASSRFDWTYFARVWKEPALRRANFGYLGHMFELYAMWTWAPRLLLHSYHDAGWSERWAKLAGFATVAVGALGCLLAGSIADRVGRCRTTIASLVVSGSCALAAGSLYQQPGLLTLVCLIWGFAVVADSAQFSAAVSELCDRHFVGTALTIQTCAGFLLTTLTIRFVPVLQETLGTAGNSGWTWPLALLAIGPAFGIFHMARLQRMDESKQMANGNR